MASYPLMVTLEGVTRDINLYTVPGVLLTRFGNLSYTTIRYCVISSTVLYMNIGYRLIARNSCYQKIDWIVILRLESLLLVM